MVRHVAISTGLAWPSLDMVATYIITTSRKRNAIGGGETFSPSGSGAAQRVMQVAALIGTRAPESFSRKGSSTPFQHDSTHKLAGNFFPSYGGKVSN
jgi:hypothetical protein